MPSYHIAPITQVDRPIIHTLPTYRHRVGVDNAFNIPAIFSPEFESSVVNSPGRIETRGKHTRE